MYCGSLNIVLHLFTSYQQYQLSQHGPVSYHLWKENRNNVCTHMYEPEVHCATIKYHICLILRCRQRSTSGTGIFYKLHYHMATLFILLGRIHFVNIRVALLLSTFQNKQRFHLPWLLRTYNYYIPPQYTFDMTSRTSSLPLFIIFVRRAFPLYVTDYFSFI